MASELLKNRALIQRLKEPKLPTVDFSLSTASFESTLPEPKPQELLDIQENVRIQRQQDTMNKARPFLMDESVDFIERENFRLGSMPSDVQGPFPGYESKPGKYAVRTLAGVRELSLSQLENLPGFTRKTNESIFFDTKANAKKFLNSQLLEDVYKKSALESSARGSRAFKRSNPALFKKIMELAESGEVGPTAIGKHPDVVKLNKGKDIVYGTIKNIIEAEKGKEFFKNIAKLKSFQKSDTRLSLEKKLPQLKKDYLDGMSTIKLTKKYLPDSKSKSSTTLESVLKDMIAGKLPTKITKTELAKRPDLTGTSGGQVIKKDPKKLAAIIKDIPKMANKEVQEKHKITSTTLNEIKNEYNLEFGKKLFKPKSPEVTDRLNKIFKIVKSANLPSGSIKGDSPIVKKLADKAGMGVKEFLSNVNSIRQDPTRLNLSKKDIKPLSRFPDPGFTQGLLQVKGYSPKTINAVRAVERAASSVTEAGSQLEHALPKALIKKFNLPRKYFLTAERTTNFLNQFKKQFDTQLINAAKAHAAGEIGYPEYKREVARISKIVSDKTGGYKIGYVDFKDGKPFAVTPQETLLKGEGELGKKTKGLKNYFKNAIYHNNLYDNYTKNPNDPAFGTLREEIKQGKYNFVKEVEAENTAKAINNFTKPEEFFSLYQKNPDNIFFKALSKAAGLAGGRGKLLLAGGATLPLLTTALAAETGNKIEDEPGLKDADPVLTKTEAGAGLAAPLATKKGRSIYGKAAKGLLRALSAIDAPAIAAPLTGYFGYQLGKDISAGEKTDVTGADLLLAPAFTNLAASELGLLNPARQGLGSYILRAGLTPQAASRILPMISKGSTFALPAVETAIRLYNARKDLEEAREEYGMEDTVDTLLGEAPREYYEKIMSELPEVDREGAMYGGRIGFAEGDEPPDPKRRLILKGMGILGLLPFGVGKLFKSTKPVVEKLVNTPTQMPDWFPNFVQKFMNNSIGKKIDADLMEYENPDLPGIKVTRSDDGRVFVEGKNEYDQPYEIQYEPPGYELVDPKTGQSVKTPGNFEAVEGRHVAVGPEDYDVEAYYPEDLDEIAAGDIRAMEKYATGKVSGTVKDSMGTDTGLKKGEYDLNMAEGRAEAEADIARDLDD